MKPPTFTAGLDDEAKIDRLRAATEEAQRATRALADAQRRGRKEKEEKPRPSMPERLDILAMLGTDPEPLDEVFPGMLAGTVGALIASGGAGKSWLLLMLAIYVATGIDAIGLPDEWKKIKRGRALYLPAEDPAAVIWHRLRALSKAQEWTAEQCKEIADGLEIYPMLGMGADLAESEWAALLGSKCKGMRLVIYDTLRRYHKKEENDGGQMAEILAAMESAAAQTGAAIIYAHHANKAAVLNGKAGEQGASRGASTLTDNARWQANLAALAEKEAKDMGIPADRRGYYIRLGIPKKNYGSPSPEILLERQAGGWLRATQPGTAAKPTSKAKWAPDNLMP